MNDSDMGIPNGLADPDEERSKKSDKKVLLAPVG